MAKRILKRIPKVFVVSEINLKDNTLTILTFSNIKKTVSYLNKIRDKKKTNAVTYSKFRRELLLSGSLPVFMYPFVKVYKTYINSTRPVK